MRRNLRCEGGPHDGSFYELDEDQFYVRRFSIGDNKKAIVSMYEVTKRKANDYFLKYKQED